MKKPVRFLCLLCAVCVFISAMCLPAFSAEEEINYLLLGDSITQGFGIANPDEASYGKIVADTNGFLYKNDAVVARDSGKLLNFLKYDAPMRSDVRQADIISLSIGSNDYLANDEVVFLVIGALLGTNNKKLDSIAEAYYKNLCAIIDEIHALNPDVVILIQNDYVSWSGLGGKAFEAGVSRVNATIDRYLREHEDSGVYLCDIAPAISGHKDRVADDCTHPNALGNVEIAKLVNARLYELGLSDKTEIVVNAEGINYNFFEQKLGKFFGAPVTVLVKLLTGNAENIIK